MAITEVGRPEWPFRMNLDSPQAIGLVSWWPMVPSSSLLAIDSRFNPMLAPTNGATFSRDPIMGWVADLSGGTTQHFTSPTVPSVVTAPMTMVGWFNVVNTTTIHQLFQIASGTNRFALEMRGNEGGNPVGALTLDVGGFGIATSTTGYSVNTWHHVCAVFVSTVSRFAYLDAGGRGSNTTSRNPVSLVNTNIGAASNGLHGLAADIRLYDYPLSDRGVERLYDPQTRWDLYEEERPRRTYLLPVIDTPITVGTMIRET